MVCSGSREKTALSPPGPGEGSGRFRCGLCLWVKVYLQRCRWRHWLPLDRSPSFLSVLSGLVNTVVHWFHLLPEEGSHLAVCIHMHLEGRGGCWLLPVRKGVRISANCGIPVVGRHSHTSLSKVERYALTSESVMLKRMSLVLTLRSGTVPARCPWTTSVNWTT